MTRNETSFPECCRYCPHRASVKGNCNHHARQSLVQVFADGASQQCPIYADVRANAMRNLSERLDRTASDSIN